MLPTDHPTVRELEAIKATFERAYEEGLQFEVIHEVMNILIERDVTIEEACRMALEEWEL